MIIIRQSFSQFFGTDISFLTKLFSKPDIYRQFLCLLIVKKEVVFYSMCIFQSKLYQ